MLVLEEMKRNAFSSDVECKGLFFRCNINRYFLNGKYVEKVSFSLLKRKSCAGCEKCNWMLEELSEFADYDGVKITNAKDKALYKLVVNAHKDWEAEFSDDYDFRFEKVCEKQTKGQCNG
jgi:hypothetical protein